jgi:hypothetical protein
MTSLLETKQAVSSQLSAPYDSHNALDARGERRTLPRFAEKYGPWALITGASSGIGAEFAEQLAQKGLNLVLAARRKGLLEQRARLLEVRYGIEVKTVQVDVNEADFLERIRQITDDVEIGLLVNNAGIAAAGAFVLKEPVDVSRLIQVNVAAVTKLARHYAGLMAARGRGGIAFVASTLGYQAVPYFDDYAASKAFVLALGEALHFELRPKGVDVTVLSPGGTNTDMKHMEGIEFSKMPLPWMSVERTVRIGINSLGRKPSVIPGVVNRLMAFTGKYLTPRRTLVRSFGWLVGRAVDSDRR